MSKFDRPGQDIGAYTSLQIHTSPTFVSHERRRWTGLKNFCLSIEDPNATNFRSIISVLIKLLWQPISGVLVSLCALVANWNEKPTHIERADETLLLLRGKAALIRKNQDAEKSKNGSTLICRSISRLGSVLARIRVSTHNIQRSTRRTAKSTKILRWISCSFQRVFKSGNPT